jgi:hypothetical protein
MTVFYLPATYYEPREVPECADEDCPPDECRCEMNAEDARERDLLDRADAVRDEAWL